MALPKLDDDFIISADGEHAVISGEMEITVERPAADRFQMMLKFPGGEELEVRIARNQLLEQLDVGDDES